MRAASGPAFFGAGLRSAGRPVTNATEPSGPNSVLGLHSTYSSRFHFWLAESTDDV
jgi:hypothetical protein